MSQLRRWINLKIAFISRRDWMPGWHPIIPGVAHDSRVTNTGLIENLRKNRGSRISEGNYHILGDSAFAEVLVPFKEDHPLSDDERRYNIKLSKRGET